MQRQGWRRAATAVVVSFAFTATAAAQGPGGTTGPGGGVLQRFDANNDGKVTEEEFRLGQTQMFDAIDSNRDGSISSDELAAYAQSQRASRRLAKMDADTDGKVSREEFERYGQARFAQADANHDDAVTADEWARGPAGKPGGGKGPGAGGCAAGGAAGGGGPRPPQAQ